MSSIKLIKALSSDTALLHDIQVSSFMPLYEKYHDDDTSPAKESADAIAWKINNSDFYIVYEGDEAVGGVRVVADSDNICRISPIFLLPRYQNKGMGSKVMELVFSLYPKAEKWQLATISEEELNCHFYEKLGFVRTGSRTVINEHMTIIGFEKTI